MIKTIKSSINKNSNVKYDFSHLFENIESTNKKINKVVKKYENKHIQGVNKIFNEDRKITDSPKVLIKKKRGY